MKKKVTVEIPDSEIGEFAAGEIKRLQKELKKLKNSYDTLKVEHKDLVREKDMLKKFHERAKVFIEHWAGEFDLWVENQYC